MRLSPEAAPARNAMRSFASQCRFVCSSAMSAMVVLTIASCTTAPPAESSFDTQASAQIFETRRLEDAALLRAADAQTPCVQPCAWTLDRLTLAAWSFDPKLAEARAALRRTEAEAEQARQRPNPTLGLSSEYNRDAGPTISPWLLSAALEFTFETGGKRALRGEIADADLEAQGLAYAAQAGAARQRLRQARLNLAAREREQAFAARIEALQHERAELLRHRLQLGALARPESDQAEREALFAMSARASASSALTQAKTELAAALSLPPEALQGIALASLPAFDADAPEFSPQALETAAVDHRLDLRQALAAYRRAQAGLRLEIAKRTPDIAIGPGLIFDQGDHKFSLAANLIAPLFDRNRHGIAAAEAARDEAAAHVVAVQTDAFAQVAAAQSHLRSALALLSKLDGSVRRDREDLGLLERRLRSGAIDRVEWIDAQLLVLQGEKAREDALTDVYAAIGEVESAVQRPLWPTSSLGEGPQPTPDAATATLPSPETKR